MSQSKISVGEAPKLFSKESQKGISGEAPSASITKPTALGSFGQSVPPDGFQYPKMNDCTLSVEAVSRNNLFFLTKYFDNWKTYEIFLFIQKFMNFILFTLNTLEVNKKMSNNRILPFFETIRQISQISERAQADNVEPIGHFDIDVADRLQIIVKFFEIKARLKIEHV